MSNLKQVESDHVEQAKFWHELSKVHEDLAYRLARELAQKTVDVQAERTRADGILNDLRREKHRTEDFGKFLNVLQEALLKKGRKLSRKDLAEVIRTELNRVREGLL